MQVLPDIIDKDVWLLICGYNAGPISAKARHYFSNPQHRFWRTLYEEGLTPTLLTPTQDARLLKYGIGLTDLMKQSIHGDGAQPSDSDRSRLESLVLKFEPRILAFLGKRPAVGFLGRDPGWGKTGHAIKETEIWMAPDPSPANGHFNKLKSIWREIGHCARR